MSTARDIAYDCVMAVSTEGAYANLLLPSLLEKARLEGRDAGFATELAYGALRMRGLYDAIIGHASGRDPRDLDAEVRVALWLGTHQALAMRVPSHAAVNETVDQVRRERGVGASKFANAVMRRVTERDAEGWLATVAPGDSRSALAIRHSHPEWVVAALDEALAADGRPGEVVPLLESDNSPARVTLVARPGLIDREELIHEAGGEAGEYSPYAVVLPGGRPGDLPAVAEATAAVQDEGSQIVAAALAAAQPVEPGERWLDLCSGPGGKAALLGALAADGAATLDAVELHPHRADLVKSSTRAVPEGVVTVHTGDGTTWGEDGAYDRIVLDAPCSGLGALRRRPESRWRRQPEDLPELEALQRSLLANAERLLAPGGLLAYITCSPVVAETRDIVAGSTLRQLDAREAVAKVTGTTARMWGPGPHVQLWTHVHGTDAMFLALLEKPLD
ncbi:RsmB/NOP family class I SAM-dependent RNA methyltransferase [Demequina mangrovi]|uniref:16S rRNA (Cytosine967-C5)-methyltransferase n=1 Tax=Demequina mangrovi TaxID=1043493 RepID=A0A1H6UBU8_9MICO|nr:transcription antitermination factor NusB [Demequina mangrovi]SEI85695.1 16S rRNA (cytosine967-C5)-methyltransferase [Demequina mangrovi]